MHPIAFYFFKVIICSSVLFGYYWLFLRNKLFHHFNRFYLLGTIVLSLTIPFIRIDVLQKNKAAKPGVISMLQVVIDKAQFPKEEIIKSGKTTLNPETLMQWAFIFISAMLAIIYLNAILRIYLLKKKNPQQQYGNMKLIFTDDSRAPFSFFKNIFWNNRTELNSVEGQLILKHEIAHVEQKNSHDKMFMNAVLVIFWYNPVFWLLRRELSMLHEFIADEQAITGADTGLLAVMILQAAYPGYHFDNTCNFFYSPIKRRLMMLKKNNRTAAGYVTRILVLPVAVVLFTAFSIRTRQSAIPLRVNKPLTVVIDAGHGGADNGAVTNNGILEKDLALKYVKLIKRLNTNPAINIVLNRETDVYQSPKEKAIFNNKAGADLFISVHFDNDPQATLPNTGMEIFVARDAYSNSYNSKLFASAVIASFKKNYGLAVPAFPQQREKGIWILQETICPSVLIEAGYFSNKKDLSYLLSDDGENQFANNVLNAINQYANSQALH